MRTFSLPPVFNIKLEAAFKSPPVISIPFLAVTTPIESTLVTSSYVRVPPIETLPLKVDIPVTVIPSGKFGAPLPAAFSILSVYTAVSYTHLTLPTILRV